jgi:hypothetical protein
VIIINKRANLKWFGDTLLMPGTSVVDDAVWTAIKAKYPKAEALLEPSASFPDGELVEVPGDSIAMLSESRAARVVFETVDPALLNKWRKGEKRPKVLAAFKAKAEEFELQRKASAAKAEALAAEAAEAASASAG